MAEYGVIGIGAIAASIVTGLCGQAGEPSILLSPRNAALSADLARRFPSVRVAATNQAVVDASSTLILCLRPPDAGQVLSSLRFSQPQAIISVIAGISIDGLNRLVGPARDVARAIPLPSVAAREGTTPIFPATSAAKTLFGRLGITMELENEASFEAISASSGTIAAFYAYLEAISGWLIGKGIAEPAARRYVAASFAGLASGLGSTSPDLGRLAREHATPGGINEFFLGSLLQAGFPGYVHSGLDQVFERLTSSHPPEAMLKQTSAASEKPSSHPKAL